MQCTCYGNQLLSVCLVIGFGFNASSLQDIDSAVKTYHKIIEAFKFAFGRRSALGDAQFWNVSEVYV